MSEQKTENYTREDRDLLITVKTKLDILLESFTKMENNTLKRVESLEFTRAEVADVNILKEDREARWAKANRRLDVLENWKSFILGLFFLSGVMAALIVYIYNIRHDDIGKDVTDVKIMLEKHISDQIKVTTN